MCHTFYLTALSPYGNGSYVIRAPSGLSDDYTLYCFCQGQSSPTRSHGREVKTFRVSKTAHDRGYGTGDEVRPCAVSESKPVSPRFKEFRSLGSQFNFSEEKA